MGLFSHLKQQLVHRFLEDGVFRYLLIWIQTSSSKLLNHLLTMKAVLMKFILCIILQACNKLTTSFNLMVLVGNSTQYHIENGIFIMRKIATDSLFS